MALVATARVSRGRKSQQIAADYLKPVFPDAASIAASLPGKDILGTPNWSFEVKARSAFNPLEWIRQARKAAKVDEYSAVIMRPNGLGEERVGEWLVFMTFADFVDLMDELQEVKATKRCYELGIPVFRAPKLSNRTNP